MACWKKLELMITEENRPKSDVKIMVCPEFWTTLKACGRKLFKIYCRCFSPRFYIVVFLGFWNLDLGDCAVGATHYDYHLLVIPRTHQSEPRNLVIRHALIRSDEHPIHP